MALRHENFGRTLVKVGVDLAGQVDLGYSNNGVSVRVEPRYLDIPSDDYAGDAGAPSDSQIVGAIARISIQLHKFDQSEFDKLSRYAGATVPGAAGPPAGPQIGEIPVLGSFLRQDSYLQYLSLDGTLKRMHFPKAFVRDAWETNAATRYSSGNVVFEAWIDDPSTRLLFTQPAV